MSNPRENFLSQVYEKYRRRSRLGSESQHTTSWKEFFMWWNVSIFTYWICLISMSMLYNMLQYLYWFLSGLAIDQLFAKLQTFDLLGFITRQHSSTITQKFEQLFLFIENLSNQCTNTKSSQSETKCNALQDDDCQYQYYCHQAISASDEFSIFPNKVVDKSYNYVFDHFKHQHQWYFGLHWIT